MVRILALATAAFALTLAAVSAEPVAPAGNAFGFLTHAAFFSVESRQANLLDPQVFIADRAAAATTGPQGIAHVAGFRPAFGVDDPAAPLANAQARPLGIDLASWFGAHGVVILTSAGANTRASFAFTGLIRNGRYSLFENHFAATGVTFTPLDGTATANSFTSSKDGAATLQLTIPGAVTHAEGILLVYHSDGTDHGMQRGDLGVTAHHQLIVRVP